MSEPADFEILTVDVDDIDPGRLLMGWQTRLGSEWLPMLVTALGDAFVQSTEQGRVAFLDFATGALEAVCETPEQLQELLENAEFVDHYFDPQAVQHLMAAGVRREPNEVYALRIPVAQGGAWTLDNVLVREVGAHFCGDS